MAGSPGLSSNQTERIMAFQVSRFSEFAEMFAQAEQNANDLADAKDRITTLEREVNEQLALNSRLTTLLEDTQFQLSEVARERDTFRSQYRDADALVNTLRGDLDASQALLSESRDEVTKLGDLIASLEARLSKAEVRNYDLNQETSKWRSRIEQAMDLADKMISVLQPDDWRHPDVPLPVTDYRSASGPAFEPVPEVASLPPTHPDNTSTVVMPQPWGEGHLSEAPKEPQPVGETASPEHGSSVPQGGDWRSIF